MVLQPWIFWQTQKVTMYTFKRSYHKNKSSEDVKKIIVISKGKWILFWSIDIEFKM